jgi:hypothetical protein
MRVSCVDRWLVFSFLLALLFFGALKMSLAAPINPCDNKCRMRNYWFWSNTVGGVICTYAVNPDCKLCLQGQCVINANDPNTNSTCPCSSTGNTIASSMGGKCGNACQVPPGNYSESPAYYIAGGTGVQLCQCK